MRIVVAAVLCLLIVSLAPGVMAQQDAAPSRIAVEPERPVFDLGSTLQLHVRVLDGAGNMLDMPVLFFSANRRQLTVTPEGLLSATGHGEFAVIAIVPNAEQNAALLQQSVPVRVTAPALQSVDITGLPGRFYAGSAYDLQARVIDAAGNVRDDVPLRWSIAATSAASATVAGSTVMLLKAGAVGIRVAAGELTADTTIAVAANPVAGLAIHGAPASVRTGDVVRLQATVRDAAGTTPIDVPLTWSVSARTTGEVIAPSSSAQIAADGRFVAELPGVYTITATAGGRAAATTITATRRDIARPIELVGRAPVRDRHTSDLWVWEGADGRDYAITGTWGSDGTAYVWDVTDPAHMQLVQQVQVDARTVNDVKVSEDGRIAVISREGASNRRNGLVILDVSNPRAGIPVLSRFDDELTGGVHNVFVYEDHVYALSAGQRYDIINIEDPANPHRVGRFELDTPGHSIHDVWVSQGIAYSSNWSDGVVAVDVGGGGHGGSPRNPVMLGSYAYPSGWNHAAYPYRSASTGKFYVFAGDEAFPYGLNTAPGSAPSRAAGWIHVIAWDKWDQPREVARYEVPEAGTHNLWIEDDVLYVAYYNGGLRVVDVSGELMGDLYRQGREIARFVPDDPEGYSANAPMVWGPQPYKGHIFFSDWNSGLWAVKLAGNAQVR